MAVSVFADVSLPSVCLCVSAFVFVVVALWMCPRLWMHLCLCGSVGLWSFGSLPSFHLRFISFFCMCTCLLGGAERCFFEDARWWVRVVVGVAGGSACSCLGGNCTTCSGCEDKKTRRVLRVCCVCAVCARFALRVRVRVRCVCGVRCALRCALLAATRATPAPAHTGQLSRQWLQQCCGRKSTC